MVITDGQSLETIWVVYRHLGAERSRTWARFYVAALLAELIVVARVCLNNDCLPTANGGLAASSFV